MRNTFAFAFHIFIPVATLLGYLQLVNAMKRAKVYDAPYVSYFLVFFIYGGALLTVYTVLFWEWSGMSSFGLAFLMIVAPLLMVGITKIQYKNRGLTIYHSVLHSLASAYIIVTLIAWMLLSRQRN